MKALAALFLFAITVNSAFARKTPINSNQKPYYGADFYSQVLGRTQNDELKIALNKVLESGHVPVEGGFDRLVSETDCGSIKDCYKHVVYGYNPARKFLFGQFYLVQVDSSSYGIKEMYCDRVYQKEDFKGTTQPGPGVIPDSTVINIEHTWPQSKFTSRYSKEMQKSDMHHLFPTDSAMNSLRSNNLFGEVDHDKGKAKCAASRSGTGSAGNTTIYEPPANHKGDVARALFYFSIRYNMPIRSEEEVVLKKWHHEHPVDEEEMDRNDAIAQIQGDRNPFIDHPEMVDQIADF